MKKVILSVLSLSLLVIVSCGDGKSKKETVDKKDVVEETAEVDPMKDKGIGPITNVTLSADIDQELASKGAEVFKIKCAACHKPEKRFIGPAPKGIMDRRTPEWIMNMILNPEEMVQKNAAAKALLAEYLSPMANQNLTEEEARSVLEYFRTLK